MEIRFATTSPTPIPTRGTGLPTAGWYAATGDVRPRAAVVRSCGDVVEAAEAVEAYAAVDVVEAGVVGGVASGAVRRDVRGVARSVVRGVVAARSAVAPKAVVMNAAVQQHLPFLPLQGLRPRGAPV